MPVTFAATAIGGYWLDTMDERWCRNVAADTGAGRAAAAAGFGDTAENPSEDASGNAAFNAPHHPALAVEHIEPLLWLDPDRDRSGRGKRRPGGRSRL
jgi:hypothetical protein